MSQQQAFLKCVFIIQRRRLYESLSKGKRVRIRLQETFILAVDRYKVLNVNSEELVNQMSSKHSLNQGEKKNNSVGGCQIAPLRFCCLRLRSIEVNSECMKSCIEHLSRSRTSINDSKIKTWILSSTMTPGIIMRTAVETSWSEPHLPWCTAELAGRHLLPAPVALLSKEKILSTLQKQDLDELSGISPSFWR